jgi:hypothetical protein
MRAIAGAGPGRRPAQRVRLGDSRGVLKLNLPFIAPGDLLYLQRGLFGRRALSYTKAQARLKRDQRSRTNNNTFNVNVNDAAVDAFAVCIHEELSVSGCVSTTGLHSCVSAGLWFVSAR